MPALSGVEARVKFLSRTSPRKPAPAAARRDANRGAQVSSRRDGYDASMKLPRPCATLAACSVFVLAAVGHAQVTLVHESLTDWTHTGGGSWTDNKPEATSEFGVVDQLNSASQFTYGKTYNLQAGIHTVTMRVRKITSTVGQAPLELRVTINGTAHSVTLAVADQPLDTWVNTPTLWFQTPVQDTKATVELLNTDTGTTKANYQFDSARLTLITHAKHLRHHMMNKWTHTWGPPYWADGVADPEADFGIVDWLLNVWWLEYTRSMIMQPGEYTIHFRLKKRTGTNGMANFDFNASANGNSFTHTGWTNHPVDVYTTGPELRFTVSQPDTDVSFWLRDISGNAKFDYYFDTARVDYADYRPFGLACNGPKGPPTLLPNLPPKVNNFFRLKIENLAGASAVAVTIGTSDQVWNGVPLPIDLGLIGMENCKLYTDMAYTSPAQIVGDTAFWGFPVPNDPALVDAVFFNQGFVLSPGSTTLGVIATNAGKGIVRQ
jgi:hypothetical protein